MKARLLILILVLAAFGIFTGIVVMNHGYTGFIDLALREQWGMQILVDLVIALTLFLVWMFPDAKKHGVPAVPYLVLTLGAGSIGALAYLIHRTVKQMRMPTTAAARA